MFAHHKLALQRFIRNVSVSTLRVHHARRGVHHGRVTHHVPPPPHPPAPQPSVFVGGAGAGAGAGAGNAGGSAKSGFWSRFLRRAIRAGQVAFLSYTVYQYGYQSGVIAYMKNHEEMDQMYIDMAMQQKGIDAVEPTQEIVNVANANRDRVRKIVKKLLTAAEGLADDEARKAIDHYAQTGLMESKELAEKWIEAKKTVSGNWNIILLKNPSVNAYVTSVCPKKIFVFAGLIQALNPTDDELALVLAHELSHAMMGHGGEWDMWVHSFLIILQLIFITLIDPVGFHVFAFDIGANSLRRLFEASFSRDHENEADELGMRIALRACYHPEQGATVMKRLAELQKKHEQTDDYHKTTMFDDHPASIDRYNHLLEMYAKLPEEEKNRCAPAMHAMKSAAPGLWRTLFG